MAIIAEKNQIVAAGNETPAATICFFAATILTLAARVTTLARKTPFHAVIRAKTGAALCRNYSTWGWHKKVKSTNRVIRLAEAV